MNIPSSKGKWKYELARIEMKSVEKYTFDDPVCVFLGVMQEDPHVPLTFEEPGLFAVDLSSAEEETILSLIPDSLLLPGYPAAMQLVPSEAGIYAEARTMLAWHDRYQFCPTCGSSSSLDEGGYKRVCSNMECRSHNGTTNDYIFETVTISN